ncbi:transposase [bacterium]|nr:transposase [bacterium]
MREHVRVKYARRCQGNVVVSAMPAQPIEKGLPGPGLLAHVLVSKYCDHLPLHRQEAIAQRYGIELSRGTMSDW